MLLNKLFDERSRGRGWVRVLVESDIIINGASLCSIERFGVSRPILGANGWQVASHLLPIEIQEDSPGERFYFFLGPEVVQHMQTGINYQFTIFDLDSNLLGAFPCPWKGVPGYSPPRTGITVGVSPEPVNISPTPVAPEINQPDESSSATLGGNAVLWGLGSTNVAGERSAEETFPVDQLNSIVESQPIDTPVSSSDKSTPPPIEIYKIACPHCRHSILSNMTFCPICSRPI